MQPAASSRSASHAAWLLPPISSRAFAIIVVSRACAPAISPGTSAVSGMFFQYFLGISFSIAPILTRAGLKMLA